VTSSIFSRVGGAAKSLASVATASTSASTQYTHASAAAQPESSSSVSTAPQCQMVNSFTLIMYLSRCSHCRELCAKVQRMQEVNDARSPPFSHRLRIPCLLSFLTLQQGWMWNGTDWVWQLKPMVQPQQHSTHPWQRHLAPDGQSYWWNSVTGESQWFPPTMKQLTVDLTGCEKSRYSD
jgi:hypothetical protein